MKLKYKLIVTLMILLVGGFFIFVSASQPTQQSNKIYLNPFYTQFTSSNTNYSYFVNVNPPDKIKEVLSSIISFDVYLTPTVNFELWVNDMPCNNPTFQVHTTYAGAGQGRVNFDCSNIITQAGKYNLTLKADKNTGAITGWLDLTYMNDPVGTADIFGTEYTIGDSGRVFLQLKDNQGFPENNATCYLNAYYPNQINSTIQPYIINAPMLYLDGSDGIYYYDITTLPNITGVYMLSAGCSYSLLQSFVYYTDGTDPLSPTRYNTTGTFSASTILLNSYGDNVYTSCYASIGSKICEAVYEFDLLAHFTNDTEITDLSLFYMGEANYPVVIYFDVYNYFNNSWYRLPNSLTFSGKATSTAPTGLNDFISNQIPTNQTNFSYKSVDNKITIRVSGTYGVAFYQYDNWLNIRLSTTTGSLQELKGSGEIHLNNIPRTTTDLVNNETPTWVWNYTERNLTSFDFDVVNETEITENVWNYSGNVSQNILSQFASSVWNWMGSVSDNIGDFFSTKVWNNPVRNLTYTEDVVNYIQISDFVWNNTERNLTYFPTQLDLTNYTLIEELIIKSETNYTKLAEFVWNWTSRDLTNFSFIVNATINNTELINQIWDYSNRTLTYYPDMTNYTLINVGVWTYENRTLFFLYGEENGKVPIGSGKLPLTNIDIQIPDPFYFDKTYTIYYDPINMKGETVEIEGIQSTILENITYTLTTPVIMTDGRYKQDITIPIQEVSSVTLSVNMTQNFIISNQKAFINPTEEKKGGITGFVTIDNQTKKNLFYLLFIFLFLVFLFVIVGVVNKNGKEKKNKSYHRY